MNHLTGPLPLHQYCYVDGEHIGYADPFVPCVWFGLVSFPGRLWGATVMLECGAVYRSVPLHKLAHRTTEVAAISERDAATWDCYGYAWSATIYPYLASLECSIRTQETTYEVCDYLFSVSPIGDGYSAAPEQSKEFTFVAVDETGRYSAQPTDRVLFRDRSFTRDTGWPTLKRQRKTYSCEGTLTD